MNPILVIARLTFREAIRRKIVLAALLLGIAFLVLYGTGLYFIQRDLYDAGGFTPPAAVRNEAYNFMTLAGMYVVNFLSIATGALLTADSLAGEVQSGTIQATVTKPIRRSAVVFGKWVGIAILLLFYLLMMGGGVVLVVRLITQYQTPNWVGGLGLIYFSALIIMTLTLMFSSSLSTLATGGVIFGLFGLAFIGGWVEKIGTFLENQTAVDIGIFSSLLLPTEALWNKSSSLMSSPLFRMTEITPFTSTSEPSTIMMAYSALYLVSILALTVQLFSRRDL